MAVEAVSKLDVRLDETHCPARSGLGGVGFVRELAKGYDLSKLAYLKLAPGSGGGSRVYGVCRLPSKHGKTPLTRNYYRISCFVQGPFPDGVSVRRPPIYRNDDGSWPVLPANSYITGHVSKGEPPAKAWWRITSVTHLENAAEAVVWICAHELFHYLRATRQIPGRNTEIEADAFADRTLALFTDGLQYNLDSAMKEIHCGS